MKLSVSLLSGVLLLSMLSLTNNSDAQALSGKVCKKAGLKKIEGSKLFTCTKSGQRFVWNKGIELEEADIVFVSTKMTFGSGVKYYFTATKGDECLVSLYVNSQLQDSQTYSITSASKVESSFWSDPVSNSWIQLDCKFSGSDSEFIPNDFVVKPSPTPRVTVSPTPTPRVTVSPSPTPRVTATAMLLLKRQQKRKELTMKERDWQKRKKSYKGRKLFHSHFLDFWRATAGKDSIVMSEKQDQAEG
jgi:hypothetical protein